MGQLYTVTVDASQDPLGGVDREATAALRALAPEATARRDDVYFLELPATTGRRLVERFARDFLAGDPARRAVVLDGAALPGSAAHEATVLVGRRPGVMDPVAGSVLHALRDAGLDPTDCRVRTARRYRLAGAPSAREPLERLVREHLGNAVVDEWQLQLPGAPAPAPWQPFREGARAGAGAVQRVEVPLRALETSQLDELSRSGGLSLGREEMLAIQAHYRELGREPTDVELETLAQTWSEHCCHKTFTGPIDHDGERIENLLKHTIFAVTRELAAPFCLSVFEDNAGVIALDDEWALTFKVETHNHPSALEPYGGAGTGIGGVIRDTLGTGLGAQPILNTDVFCFGPLDLAPEELPPGTLPPRRLLEGVVAGVRDYGNRMGIPTANGAILFDAGYVGNPLVFCGSLGLIPRRFIDKQVRAGDLIVAIGGRTGRDGIHGATFSSRELTEESETVSAGAVQIGNPIEEKKVQDALLRARDEGLYSALTDCGAGGFSSAIGEMGAQLGAQVDLAHAPLKYEGLAPREIWISEAQERMVLAVPPAARSRLFEILAEEEVEGCVLGTFGGEGMLRIHAHGVPVGELSMQFLHGGRPRLARASRRPQPPAQHAHRPVATAELPGLLERLLAHPTIASKEPVIRQYDHEVQGRIVLGPLGGAQRDAPQDGVALAPLRDERATVVVGCGIQPGVGRLDPYQMGAHAVDEAVRNVIAAGGDPGLLALLDNFAWGNVHDPEILGAAVECARGAAAAARAYRAPFISGKDSLHNTYRTQGVARSIPHTLLVSAVSVARGAPRAPGSDLKRAGSRLLLVGAPRAELAGSLAQQLLAGAGGRPAPFEPELGPRIIEQLARWIQEGRILSCHDLSEGGLLVAAAEMAFGGDGLGLALDLVDLAVRADLDDPVALLFGEGPHRFLVEVEATQEPGMCAAEIPVVPVGTVTDEGLLRVFQDGVPQVAAPVAALKRIWQAPLASVWPGEGA